MPTEQLLKVSVEVFAASEKHLIGFHQDHISAQAVQMKARLWSGAGCGNPYLGVTGPGGTLRIDGRRLLKLVLEAYPEIGMMPEGSRGSPSLDSGPDGN